MPVVERKVYFANSMKFTKEGIIFEETSGIVRRIPYSWIGGAGMGQGRCEVSWTSPTHMHGEEILGREYEPYILNLVKYLKNKMSLDELVGNTSSDVHKSGMLSSSSKNVEQSNGATVKSEVRLISDEHDSIREGDYVLYKAPNIRHSNGLSSKFEGYLYHIGKVEEVRESGKDKLMAVIDPSTGERDTIPSKYIKNSHIEQLRFGIKSPSNEEEESLTMLYLDMLPKKEIKAGKIVIYDDNVVKITSVKNNLLRNVLTVEYLTGAKEGEQETVKI